MIEERFPARYPITKRPTHKANQQSSSIGVIMSKPRGRENTGAHLWRRVFLTDGSAVLLRSSCCWWSWMKGRHQKEIGSWRICFVTGRDGRAWTDSTTSCVLWKKMFRGRSSFSFVVIVVCRVSDGLIIAAYTSDWDYTKKKREREKTSSRQKEPVRLGSVPHETFINTCKESRSNMDDASDPRQTITTGSPRHYAVFIKEFLI